MFKYKNLRNTVISKKTTLEGSLHSSDDIHILGKVTHNVISKHKVTVLKSGSVLGKINANKCLIKGKVSGDLDISGSVELEPSAQINGNIQAKALKVHSGVVFTYLKNKEDEILITNAEK